MLHATLSAPPDGNAKLAGVSRLIATAEEVSKRDLGQPLMELLLVLVERISAPPLTTSAVRQVVDLIGDPQRSGFTMTKEQMTSVLLLACGLGPAPELSFADLVASASACVVLLGGRTPIDWLELQDVVADRLAHAE